MSKSDFEGLTAKEKGYVVYMRGADPMYPNIPESYSPSPEDEKEYNKGGMSACLEVMG